MKFPLVLLVTIFLVVVVATTYVHVRPALPPAENFATTGNIDQDTYDKAFAYLSATMASFNAFTQENQEKYIKQFVASNPSILKLSTKSRDATSESDRLKKLGAGSMNACPTSAYFDKNGVIHVDPGNMTFKTMDQYQKFMASLVGQKSYKDCPVLEVQSMSGALSGAAGPGVFLTGQPTEYDLQREALDRSVIDTTMMKGGVVMLGNEGEQTYAETPINKLDDYEYSRIFELENAPRMEPLAQEAKSDLMSQYHLDWANLPWNSDEKAKEEEAFISGRMEDGMRDPKTGVFFRNMEGADVGPPDEAATAAREAKILSAYIPTDISKHVVDSEMERVAQVVNQAYASDPDWEPVVEKRGEHQYAVTELRPRAKKERWENDTPTVQEAKDQGILTGTSFAPDMKIDGGRSDDPYFDKAGVVDNANDRVWKYQDFNKWTPGLERMFAPTNDTQAWY